MFTMSQDTFYLHKSQLHKMSIILLKFNMQEGFVEETKSLEILTPKMRLPAYVLVFTLKFCCEELYFCPRNCPTALVEIT